MANLSPTRKLTILAKDPGLRIGKNGPMVFAQVDVPAEILAPGPTGYRIKVIDYNATERRAYRDRQAYQNADNSLRDPFACALGEKPTDRTYQDRLLNDPNFHAQNAYAVAMRTLGLFERALGRRVAWSFGGHQLHVVPHAFALTNAFYSERDRALFFGYLLDAAGAAVFTGLSHDVIAHETTHAILDGLRTRYTEPAGPDQAAFHEGFADVVAILSIFSLREVVAIALRPTGAGTGDDSELIAAKEVSAKAIRESILLGIGAQVGFAVGGGRGALRQSVKLEPRAGLLDEPVMAEPHNRGEALVAAAMHGFVELWSKRIAELGTFSRRRYNLAAVVEAGAKTAAQLLQMAIRALDYCPPTDIDFGQFLTALLTADRELVPDDTRLDYRGTLLRNFAAFGIVPPPGTDADGCWPGFAQTDALVYSRSNSEALTRDRDEAFRFLWENRELLWEKDDPRRLCERGYTEVISVDTSLRVDPDGIPFRETICQYVQMADLFGAEVQTLAGIKPLPEGLTTRSHISLFGGGIVVFDQYGRVKYHITNRLSDAPRQRKRLEWLIKTGQLNARTDDEANPFAQLHLARQGG